MSYIIPVSTPTPSSRGYHASSGRRSSFPPPGGVERLTANWSPEFFKSMSAHKRDREEYCRRAVDQVKLFAEVLYEPDDCVRLFRKHKDFDEITSSLWNARDLSRRFEFKNISDDPYKHDYAVTLLTRSRFGDAAQEPIGGRAIVTAVLAKTPESALQELQNRGLPVPSLLIDLKTNSIIEAVYRVDHLMNPEEVKTISMALSKILMGAAGCDVPDPRTCLPGVFGNEMKVVPLISPLSTRKTFSASQLVEQIADAVSACAVR